jgi:hypothetical protein
VVEINQIDDLGLVLEPLLNDLGYRWFTAAGPPTNLYNITISGFYSNKKGSCWARLNPKLVGKGWLINLDLWAIEDTRMHTVGKSGRATWYGFLLRLFWFSSKVGARLVLPGCCLLSRKLLQLLLKIII